MKSSLFTLSLFIAVLIIFSGLNVFAGEKTNWSDLVNQVATDNSNSIDTNSSDSMVVVEKKRRPNPVYYQIKQQIAQIDSQISQLDNVRESEGMSGLGGIVSNYPGMGGSLTGLLTSGVSTIATQNQYIDQLDSLRSQRMDLEYQLSNTPEEIEEAIYQSRQVVTLPKTIEKKEKVFMVLKDVSVMSEPSNKAEELGVLPKQFVVKIINKEDGWAMIGDSKWVQSKYLLEIQE